MIIAIPTQNNWVAGHFTKAPEFSIFDSQTHTLTHYPSPISEDSQGKPKKLIDWLAQFNVDTILVKNIGTKMLGKLLQQGLTVKQVKARISVADSIDQFDHWEEMTDAGQGRPSRAHSCKHQQHHCHRQQHRFGLMQQHSAIDLSKHPVSQVHSSGCGCHHA